MNVKSADKIAVGFIYALQLMEIKYVVQAAHANMITSRLIMLNAQIIGTSSFCVREYVEITNLVNVLQV